MVIQQKIKHDGLGCPNSLLHYAALIGVVMQWQHVNYANCCIEHLGTPIPFGEWMLLDRTHHICTRQSQNVTYTILIEVWTKYQSEIVPKIFPLCSLVTLPEF